MVGVVKESKESAAKNTGHGKGANKNVAEKTKKKTATVVPTKSSLLSTVEICKSVVINDQSVDKLTIKEEDLEELRKTLEENKNKKEALPSAPVKPFAVKVPKPVTKKSPERTVKYLVAKPAPPTARLKPIDSAPCGPRYTSDGTIIPHSILGTIQDFVDEAVRRNEMQLDDPAVLAAQPDVGQLEVEKYEKPKTPAPKHIPTALNQENALDNWRRRMLERKRIQGYVSNLLEKPLDRLVMSQNLNSYREKKETHNILDRALHTIDTGLEDGRVGCEVWKQAVTVGDAEKGLHTTLTRSQKGQAPDIEHVGKPLSIQKETGERNVNDRTTVDIRKSWFGNKYLKKRFRQLQPLLQDLDPHKPDIDNLEVIAGYEKKEPNALFNEMEHIYPSTLYNDIYGTQEKMGRDPLSQYPDVVAPPMVGPSIVFNGIPAYWNGSSDENKDQIGAVTRVSFECVAGNRTSSSITVRNNGTTAIFYEWRKVPYVTTLQSLQQDEVQRFYFNTTGGHILPGDVLRIPFIFKSTLAGIFTETWEFLTEPSVMGGASLCVVLKGVAVYDDSKGIVRRKEIEVMLDERDKEYVVKHIVEEIINGIQSPERPRSPLDLYLTEEEIFTKKNPGKYYDYESVVLLKEIHAQASLQTNLNKEDWGLSLVELFACVTTVPDEQKRNELLKAMNEIISEISSPILRPKVNFLYAIAYSYWLNMIDQMVSCTMLMRSSMGLPEEVMTEPITIPEIHEKKSKGKRPVSKDKEEKGKKGKANGKEKDVPRPKSSVSKARNPSSPSKETMDSDDHRRHLARHKKNIPVFVPAEDLLEPDTRRKYSEKIYGLVYNLISETIDNVASAFEDAKSN